MFTLSFNHHSHIKWFVAIWGLYLQRQHPPTLALWDITHWLQTIKDPKSGRHVFQHTLLQTNSLIQPECKIYTAIIQASHVLFKNWGLGQFSYLKIGLLNYLFVIFFAPWQKLFLSQWIWSWRSDTVLNVQAGLSRNYDIWEDLIYKFYGWFLNCVLINPTQTSYNNYCAL